MGDPFPAWIEPRPAQIQACDEICAAFESGSRVVFFDGPTGTGKTVVAEMVRRKLDTPTLYMCSDRALQDQFTADFPYARLLKGRGNYLTQHDRTRTCDECLGESCHWCDGPGVCPYVRAKRDALASDLACVNTSYFLHEANYVGEMGQGKRGLIVADEGDTLEGQLMGFVEYASPDWLLRATQMEVPKKNSRKKTIAAWLMDFADSVVKEYPRWRGPDDVKRLKSAQGCVYSSRRVAGELLAEVEMGTDSDDSGRWLRDYRTKWSAGRYVDDGILRMAPVLVAPYGAHHLWRHARKWLVMSATIIAPEEMVDTLGVPFDWSYVSSPMLYPVENRRVIMAPVTNVIRADMDHAVTVLGTALVNISEEHPGERVLVHTVSYDLAKRLMAETEGRLPFHVGIMYTESAAKAGAMTEFLGSRRRMLFAPSMDRGIDLADEKCRVQVVAKCPFPNLGDRRVSARSKLPGGEMWYQVQTVRSIVQMTGRAVRGPEDHAVTYILDKQFATNLYRQSYRLFPKWWRDSVVTTFPTNSLLKKG